ncbi:hypothetical protein [Rhizomonospora bruguierae]|uniref:hypothetical protein n=1 Tax=Rhizomonospora bruguierae TaxID=1581705 RepID=UPI001BCDF21D|nr:hypothetical protein [Micromonospora sp. NBRC 107566]
MKRMLSRAIGASALGIALAVAGLPGVAHAATTKCAYHGYDRACVTNYSSTSSTQEVCDNESDGHGVWGKFNLVGSPLIVMSFEDKNGSATGCTRYSESHAIASFVVCEDNEGCSARVYM